MFDVAKLGKGSALLSLGAAASALLSFLILPILARLLTPSDFGVAVVALSMLELGAVLGGTGAMAAAVTYFKNRGDDYDQSAFWISLFLGFCLGAVCVIYANPMADFFGSPQSAPLIRVVGFLIPLEALAGISEAFITRRQQFGKVTVVKLIASIISVIAALFLAFNGYGVWSLIWQYGLFVVLRFIAFLVLSGHKPRLVFSTHAIREMLPYIFRITGAETFVWLSRQSPLLIVTNYLGVASGGINRVSDRLTELPRQVFGESIRKSLFVGVADVSDEDAATGFLWALRLNFLILSPAYLGLISLAAPITDSVLGAQFAPFWPIVALFSLGQFVQLPFNCTQSFFQARGHASAVFLLEGFRALLIFVSVILACILFGTLWNAVLALGIAKLISTIASLIYLRQEFSIGYSRMLNVISAPLISALVMCVSTFLLYAYFLDPFGAFLSSFIGVSIGVSVYALALYILSPSDFEEAHKMLLRFKTRLRTGTGS
ncbi:oligosaccharide flippase family protein [Rhodobacteraceae bacterium]|nr:oligosaccharide flippase family protein [Paracoccaceae bacterium]